MPVNKIARRSLLVGTATAVLARAIPAAAKPAFMRGGKPASAVNPPLTIALAFADGKALSFSQASATDIGSYVSSIGGFTQQCFRQRASGNSDYRDAFTVFFRPDTSGTRDEIVIEYGTEYTFSPSVAPVPRNNVTPAHLFVPAHPTLTKTTGGSSGQSGVLNVWVTIVTASGQSEPSTSTTITLSVGDLVSVASPPAGMGATGYNVYAHFSPLDSNRTGYLQNVSPIPVGTGWTEPATGILATGTTQPTSPTTTVYTATISGGTLSSPVVISVPVHWWSARWRWFTAARPKVRTAADLVTMKAMLPLSSTYIWGALQPNATTWSGPMGTGGLEVGMGNTGDRNDIGLTTEWQAAWLVTGNSTAETSWRAGAEAAGSFTWWARDVATGTFVSLFTYPYITFNQSGTAKYRIPIPVNGVKDTTRAYFTLDQSHMPATSFIPAMLTDDPYFIEGFQQEALYSPMYGSNEAIAQGLTGIISRVQPRAWAWGLRSMASAADFSPISPPSWMLPKSYYALLLAQTQIYATKYLTSTTLQTTVFNMIPETNSIETFMQDYIGLAGGRMKWSGLHTDWDAILDYLAQIRLHLSDYTGASGWDGRYQVPYEFPIVNLGQGAAAVFGTGGTYSTLSTIYTPTSWADAWAYFIPWALGPNSQVSGFTDPSTWPPNTLKSIASGYLLQARSVLAAYALAGNAQAIDEENWLRNQINTTLGGNFGGQAVFKWAVAPF